MKLPVFIERTGTPEVDRSYDSDRIWGLTGGHVRQSRLRKATLEVRFGGTEEAIQELSYIIHQLMINGAPITLDTWDVLRKAAAAPSESKIKALPVGIIDGILEDE